MIHGAALTSDPGALGMTRAAHLSANLGMTLAALEAARAAGAARFVFVSSMGVFEPDDGPAPGGRMTEAARPTARCPYAAAKRAGEAVVAAAAEPGFATCGLRLGNVLGPHEARRPSRAHLSLAGRMREEAAGGRITARTPGALREWAWLPDLAGGIAAFLGAPWAAPVLHAGAPPACTDAALAAMIAERAGARVAPAAPPHAPVRPPMGSRSSRPAGRDRLDPDRRCAGPDDAGGGGAVRPLRLIVVGLGARARTWLRVAAADPDVEVVACCDPDPAARARAAEQVPGATIASALADVIGDGAGAALLCTPPAGREALVEACCAAGLAILAEKPLADDVASAARCVAMAEGAGVPLIVGLNFRYLAVTRAKRDLIAGGALGAPAVGRFTYERWRDGRLPQLNDYPLRMAQPMLWEQSIHHFDLMRFVYRAEPVRVSAVTSNPPWSLYAGDANVAALIEFERGLHVTYHGTWQGGLDRLDFDWRTDCEGGAVAQRSMFGDLEAGRREDAAMAPVALPPEAPWTSDAAALLAAFVATCRGAAPECTGADHLRSLAMLAACIESARRREAVGIDEMAGALTTKGIA